MADTIHWADVIAESVLKKGNKQSVAINFTPSGHVHISDARAAVIADAIYRTLLSRNVDADFILIADNYEPLLKVPPLLPESYSEYIGRPLFDIPCPCGNCANYAEHFLNLFLEALKHLGINPKVYRADEIYREDNYAELIKTALVKRDRIAEFLEEIPGKPLPENWSPFNPRCTKCGRITTTKVIGFNPEAGNINYTCGCGNMGTIPIAGGGKLSWLVALPSCWAALGVTIEISEKVHASKIGSYYSGKRIIKEIYGKEAPYPIVYEPGIFWKQEATISSRKESFSISEMLDIMSPEILRYLILRTKPEKHIKFDPGQPFLALVNEYENTKAKLKENDPFPGIFERRIYELSEVTGLCRSKVPFKQIVTIYQVARGDFEQILKILKRSGFSTENEKCIKELINNVSNWLEHYAPPFVKFSVKEKIPVKVATLSKVQKTFLKAFAASIEARNQINAEEYHLLIYSAAQQGSQMHRQIEEELGTQVLNISPKDLFKAIYISLMGQSSGPKAGWFLSSFEKAFLVKRFKEASTYIPGKLE